MWDHPKPNWTPVLKQMVGRWVTISIRTAGGCFICFDGRLQLRGEFLELQHSGGVQVIALIDVQYVNLPDSVQQEKLTLDSMQRATDDRNGTSPTQEAP